MTSSAKRAGEEADRLIASLAEQKKAAAGQPAAEPQPAAEAQVATEPVPSQATQDVGNQSDVGVQATAQPDDSEALSLRKELATANARWQSLQGMVNKKDTEIEQMRLLLAQLSQRSEQTQAQTEPSSLVTAKDEEDFGADHVELGRRIAAEVFTRMIKDVNTRITKMEQSIAGVSDATTKIAEETFDEALTRQVPNWRAVNNDPEFIVFLSDEDSFSGRTKLELLQTAYSTGNLKSTVAFFKAFESAKKPQTTAADVTAPAEITAPNVSKFVAPGKSKSAATFAAPAAQPKVWSSSDISKLYDDKRNRRITEEEFAKQESDLFAAQREGRIAA